VLNKIDCEEAQEHQASFEQRYPYSKDTLFPISALTGEGLAPFIAAMRTLAQANGKRFK
jgi:hypothetical protein